MYIQLIIQFLMINPAFLLKHVKYWSVHSNTTRLGLSR